MKNKFFKNLSIKNKLTVLVLAVAILAIGLGGSLVIFNNISTFKKDMVYNTKVFSKFVADALAAPMSFMADENINEELKRLKSLPIVENGYIYNEDNELDKEHFFNKPGKMETFTPPENPELTATTRFEGDYLHVFLPIVYKESHLGTLYLRASTALLEDKINNYLKTMLIGLIGLIILTYLLAARFQGAISRPILKLAQVTEHIKQDADFSVRVQKEGNDEIGVLYNGFNDMLEQIQLREKQRDKAEAEQKRLLGELEEKNKELEQVVYVTSHDLRSPLVNIQGFSKELGYSLEELSDLVKTAEIPEALKEQLAVVLEEDIPDSLKYILSSTTKMDTLLSGLLKLSRVGRTATTFDNVDMNELFTEITNAFEFQVQEGGVELKVEEMPPCYGNDIQLNQLFSNLLNNALKYLDPNRPGKIRMYPSHTDEENRPVYAVEDNGMGIAEDHQKKVFEIFHRLNPSDTAGEGLGLAIVNKIVNRHNGRIWVESEYGKGSTFFVALQPTREEEAED